MVSCPYCQREFKNQGGLNLHLHKSSCKKNKNNSVVECEHTSTRMLTSAELDLKNESTNKTIKDYGFYAICIKCGELIGGNINE